MMYCFKRLARGRDVKEILHRKNPAVDLAFFVMKYFQLVIVLRLCLTSKYIVENEKYNNCEHFYYSIIEYMRRDIFIIV